ncbi:MAG: hypothetical protein JW807_15405 [Spirochaetes bacterium]|nr:hypothetical protein [Spirochaetota bacterium]
MILQKTKQRLASGEPLRLVALGDSLTQGWMVRKGYVDFLAEMITRHYPKSDVTIMNRGIPGDTAEGGLYRLRDDVLDADPDLVLIQFALNDAYTGVPADRFKNTVKTIIYQIRADTDAEVLLITSVPIMHESEDRVAGEFYARIEALAREEGLPVARVHAYWKRKVGEGADFASLVQGDGVHPNLEGHRIMAEAVFEEFK